MFRQFSPAPCSPPLGGSGADSAVRFTPAGKYGGRENWPSRRGTRCIRYHPCRAHHKLKWARKGQSVLVLLHKHLPRSESNKNNSRSKAPLPSNALPPAQTPMGQPCLTGVGNNPLIVIKHHQCTVSRMPKARRSRLSLTRCAGGATLLRISTSVALNHRKPLRRLQRQPPFQMNLFVTARPYCDYRRIAF